MCSTSMKTALFVVAAVLGFAGAVFAQSAEDFLPTGEITSPLSIPGQIESRSVTSSPTFYFDGTDPDGTPAQPVRYRFLFKPAILPNGNYLNSRAIFNGNVDYLMAFSDSAWTDWFPWPADPADRRIVFHDIVQDDADGDRIHYLFAIQVMDTLGAVSLDRDYGRNVANFNVSANVAPVLEVFDPILGYFRGSGAHGTRTLDVLGDTFEFQWVADAADYGGQVASYRWGLDLIDPDDPDDPNWAFPAGLQPENRTTGPLPLIGGIHTLTIEATDHVGSLTRMQYLLTVVPVPHPSVQRPLLLVDDVVDRNSMAWLDETGTVALDNDEHRDQFWLEVLLGSNGVAGFHFEEDVIDTEVDPVTVRDLVDYRNVIWNGRLGGQNAASSNFRYFNAGYNSAPERYNWLEAYQQSVGNLFLVGAAALEQFVQTMPHPILLEADTEIYTTPLGALLPIHELLYPDRGLGVAMYDNTSGYPIYGHPGEQRNPTCGGAKALEFDLIFYSEHEIDESGYALPPGVPISTNPDIDWQDQDIAHAYDLSYHWGWGRDEFYDEDVLGRPEVWSPRQCGGQPCVEPMLRAVSRFDWLQEVGGYPDWPEGYYTPTELDELCGEWTLTEDQEAAVTNDVTVGFMSHRHDQTKPSGIADVIWGFDADRFDRDSMKEAIRWVLDAHFGIDMNPVR